MKIRVTFLAIIFALISCKSFAEIQLQPQVKAPEVKAKKVAAVKAKASDEKDQSAYIDSLKIEADLKKMFDDADRYFKAAKAWTAIKCEPKTGFICTKRECVKRDIKSYLVLNKKTNTIKRCDKDYCEEFPATYAQTGVFFNIQSDGPIGTLIRVLGDSRYKEVSTIGLDAYVANGECVQISEEEAAKIGAAKEEGKAKE